MRAESARSAPRAPRAGKKGNRVGDRSFSKSVTIRTAAKHAPNASYFEVPYIHFNPVRHKLVSRVRDWPHSSFHRYVARGDVPEDWGGDVREISGAFGE